MQSSHFLCQDLSNLNRDIHRVVIIDDEPEAFQLQRENGIQIKKFEGDTRDRELVQLIPFLESKLYPSLTRRDHNDSMRINALL